ncbi:MAG: 50S ribosomal protein L22 [Deltaproteobacteria bacterium]|nr:50S ribosomal protein L22 [Deltaproteobacteria bacterium]
MTATQTKAATKKPKREKAKADARKAARKAGPAQAHVKSVRISARKVRVLADQIRGKSVDFALTFLAFQQRAGAPILKKAIDSAVANADQKKMDLDTLVIADVQIDKAGMMRRFLPRAHGRATPFKKQLAHVHVRLAEKN